MRLFSSHDSGHGFNRLTLVDSSRLFEIDFFLILSFNTKLIYFQFVFIGLSWSYDINCGFDRLTWAD
jgi:hypothetical protein